MHEEPADRDADQRVDAELHRLALHQAGEQLDHGDPDTGAERHLEVPGDQPHHREGQGRHRRLDHPTAAAERLAELTPDQGLDGICRRGH